MTESGDAGGEWPAAGADNFETAIEKAADEVRLEIQNACSDALHAVALEHVEGRAHAVDARHVQHTGLIALGGGHEAHFVLRDKIWAENIPRAEEGWPAEVKVLALHADNSNGHWTEHPFVGVGA